MMHRLTTSSLGILPLWFVIACAPIDLTVGDEHASGGQEGTGAAEGLDTSAGGGMLPDVLPSKGDAGAPTDEPEPEPEPEPPPVDPFVCDDGVEIDKSLRCNRRAECPDGSDELGCTREPFVCADGSKVDPSLVCNRQNECADGSDELGCATDPSECGPDMSIEMAQPFDLVQGCWLPEIPIGCYKLIHPSLAVPTYWGNSNNCVRRESDGVLFWVNSVQLATEWDDCTPEELAATQNAPLCP